MRYDIINLTTNHHNYYHQSYMIDHNTQRNFLIYCSPDTKTEDIHLSFVVERNAYVRVEVLLVHVSCQLSITCIMRGEGGQAIINGAYILCSDNKVTITTAQRHEKSHATSAVNFKGVLYDWAQVMYNGMIFVAQESRATVASQENKNIVLSGTARAVSVPQLEVLSNDVHCFHGSAVGTLQKDQLFYAAARGIDLQNSQRLLIKGFFGDVFECNEAQQYVERYI